MRKGACFLRIVVAMMLSARSLEAGNAWEEGVFYREILRAAFGSLDRVISLMGPSQLLSFRADGGGDGGDGGGTGDGGSGTGDGSSGDDSTSGDSASNAAADTAAAAAAGALDAPAADPSAENAPTTVQTADPTADPSAVTQSVDPPAQNNAVTPELAAIESIPTTDPRGGEVVAPTVDNGFPPGATLGSAPGGGAPGAGRPSAGAPPAPMDVYINAVIVSAAQSPWDAIKKTPGVRNVIVTGAIIALGKTPIPGEIPGGGPEPAWLRVIPDPKLLNGSVVPPVVPNVIDIRIMNCPIKITYPDGKQEEN